MGVLYFFILLTSVQGFILAFIFGLLPKFRKISSRYLGLLLFIVSLQNLSNSLINFGYWQVEYFPLSFTLLIPLSLLGFVLYLINPQYKIGWLEYILMGCSGLQISFKVIAFIVFLVSPRYVLHQPFFFHISHFFEILALLFTLIVIYRLNKRVGIFEKQILEEYSNIELRTLSWLRGTLIVVLFLGLLWGLSMFFKLLLDLDFNLFYVVWLGVGLITYWLAYSLYIRRDIFEVADTISMPIDINEEPVLSSNTDIYHSELITLMQEEELYKDPELSMTILSSRMNLSKGYLSLIINQKEQKNFFEFVNFYRVEEVKKNIIDDAKSHYSLLGLGLEAGFKSKSTFNSVFKKITGYTPSQYKKQQIVKK